MRAYKKITKTCERCESLFEVGQNCAWHTKFCIPCRKENRRKWHRAYEKMWRANHPGWKSGQDRSYRERNREKLDKQRAEYARKHPEIRKKCWDKYNKKASLELKPAVVKSVIVHLYGIPRQIISDELVKEKRSLILLGRRIKQIQQEIKDEKIKP